MAYRFDGSTSYVKFNPAPLVGYSFGPTTWAALFKRSNVSAIDWAISLIDSALTNWRGALAADISAITFTTNLTGAGINLGVNDTSKWFVGVATWGGGAGTAPRLHAFDGTSWQHGVGGNTLSPFGTTAGTDILTVGGPANFGGPNSFIGDIACAGIKKANLTDLAVEALTYSFTTWTGFGFDWLVSFDAIGTRPDVATPGTGVETARVNVSLVADPPSFVAAAAAGSFLPFM